MEAWQDRIEKKLDDLQTAIVSLARMEERMITLFRRMDTYDTRQTDIGARVGELEKQASKRGVMYGITDRLAWIIIAAMVSAWLSGWRG